jgi:hypothetical protein
MSPRFRMAKAHHRVSEKVEQAHGVQLLRTIGAKVWVLGTVRRRGDHPGTMQTPGVADVLAFLPVRGEPNQRLFLVWECKADGGRLRLEQIEFRDACLAADVRHLVGDYNALTAWLTEHRYVKADSVPHYRQPQE